MKRIEVSILAILALLSLLLGIALVQEELYDARGDRDYYQGQYKKYYELSEELQNQMGVYYE